MSFLYPNFLFGLIAVSIPIIIHLFNLQRPKKVYFTNTAFLKNIQNISRKAVKLKNILVLFSRILFLAFLVLAFAQPYFPSKDKFNEFNYVTIYVDNSLSMESALGNERALDIGIKNAEVLGENLPASSMISVFTNDFDNTKGQFLNKERIREAVSEIDFSPKERTLSEIINKRTSSKGSNYQGRKMASYIFSDFQRSTVGDIKNLKLDSTVQYYLVPITPEQLSNIYIDSVWLENPYVNINENNLLKVRIINSGNERKENVVAKLAIDGRQAATTSTTIEANSNSVISFNFNVATPGIKKGIISVSDYPVAFDNDYYFSFKTLDKINILELHKGESTPSVYVPKVYNNEILFNYTSKDISNLDYGLLEKFDLIVLNNLENLDEGFNEALIKYVNSNGAILIIPSEKTDVISYNKLLNNFAINIIKSSKLDSISPVELKVPDIANPFYQGIFDNTKERISMPSEQAIINWNSVGIPHLSFKNGNPFFAQINQKNGRIFIFSSNLKYLKGLALHALFVPVMYKIALLSNPSEGKLAYNFNEQIIGLPVEGVDKNLIYKLKKDSVEIIPSQRISGKNLIMDVPDVDIEPGHYDVKVGNNVINAISFNYSKNESLMQFYSSEDLKKIFSNHKNVRVFESISQNEFIDEVKTVKTGFPIWKICLLIALLFLFIEIILLRFYKLYESPPQVV